MEQMFVPISIEYLQKWLEALDISREDHAWFHLQHQREIAFYSLPKQLPVTLRLSLATLMITPNVVNSNLIAEVVTMLNKNTIQHLIKRPRCADIVIDRILLENSQ